MWGSKVQDDLEIRQIKYNLQNQFLSQTHKQNLASSHMHIINLKNWHAQLCNSNRHKRLALSSNRQRRLYRTERSQLQPSRDTFLTAYFECSEEKEPTKVSATESSDNRYDFECRVRKGLLTQYEELRRTRDRLTVGLEEQERRTSKIYKKENLITEELETLTRLHTKWIGSSLTSMRNGFATMRRTHYTQLDSLKRQMVQGRRSCEEDEAEIIEVLARIERLKTILAKQTDEINQLDNQYRLKKGKIEEVAASSKLIHELVNVQRYLSQGSTQENSQPLTDPSHNFSFSSVTDHILNFYNEQVIKSRELSNYYSELLSQKAQLNSQLNSLFQHEQQVRSYLPPRESPYDLHPDALAPDHDRLATISKFLLFSEESVASLLARFTNVLRVESKNWEKYQKNIKEFMDARLTEGCRDVSTNLDYAVVGVLLRRYFENHAKYGALGEEIANNKLLTTHASQESICTLLAEIVCRKKVNKRLNTVKEIQKIPLRLTETCCQKIADRVQMMFGLLNDIMQLLHNPPRNLVSRSRRRIKTRKLTNFSSFVSKEAHKQSELLRTADTQTNINSIVCPQPPKQPAHNAFFLYRELKKSRRL